VAVASAGHVQVCTSLQIDNHASTSPLSFLQAGCPSCRPTNSVKALKAYLLTYLTRRLQSILSAAARPIYRLGTRDHITDALISLHWLRVPAYKVLYGDAPRYADPAAEARWA